MESLIKCLICQKEFKRLTQTHLKEHELTPNSYKEKFGLKTICSEESSKIQKEKSLSGQFNVVINSLNKLGFLPLFNLNNYKGISEKNLIKCKNCGNEILSKLRDKKSVVCRVCCPYKKKKVIEFKYVDILNDFNLIKLDIAKTVCGIYCIKNKINGKFYIGSSEDIRHRWYEHVFKLRKNKHINQHLQNAWNKYTEDNFEFLVIESCIKEELLNKEQYYIDTLHPFRDNGYNICETAGGGDSITQNPNRDDFIKKMTLINTGQSNGMYGKSHSIQTIKDMKNKSIGRYTLEWFVDRYGDIEGNLKFDERNYKLKNRKINYSYDNGMLGKKRGPMSQEIKDRISERKIKLNIIRKDLHKDILSDLFTIPQLELKYGTSKATILRERRKLVK